MCWMWIYSEREKNKSHGVQFYWPMLKVVFEGDNIEHVQIFKYLGILFETTLDLDNAVEHLVVVSRRSLFALNYRCA
jgi:hypothetical protein